MVGASLTAIGIVKLSKPDLAGALIEKLLALDSMLFLASAVFSFVAMRRFWRLARQSDRLESWADTVFVVGLVLMVIAAILLAFEVL